MSDSQSCGEQVHIRDGHRALCSILKMDIGFYIETRIGALQKAISGIPVFVAYQ